MILLRGMVGAFVLLAAWGLQLGAAPAAQAQQTCPAGQTYCPSGRFAGECRADTATCTGGSYTACTGCVCDPGEVLCGTTCQAPKSCPDSNRSTSNQCAASDAASCGACASGYTLDAGTCVLQAPVILAPLNPQERSSDKSAINVVQGGTGLLFNLQAQSGTDTTTRKQVLSVDKSGLMVGYDPDAAKLGIDLSAAGGQNLLYAIARATGLDAALDSLLKFQVREADGTISDRFRIDGSGNVVAAGSVRGSQLCIGADCKSSWSAVAPAGVLLQGTTPGTQQTGHLNVSGTGRVGSLVVGSSGTINLQGAAITKASQISAGAAGTTLPFLNFSSGDLIFSPTNTANGKGFTVWNGAADPTIAGFAKLWHNGVSTFIGDTTSVEAQSLKFTNGDLSVPGEISAEIGTFNLVTLTGASDTVNLQGGDVLRADTISAGASATVTPFLDFDSVGLSFVPNADSTGLKIEAWPGLKISPNPYARLWHNGTKVILNDNEANMTTGLQLDGSNLAVSGLLDIAAGIQAGSGNVNIIDATGKIPALSSTYLASLSGANLMSLNASNLSSGTVADARLPAGLLRNPIDGGPSSTGPWLTIQGGASVLANVALRLFDAGTADANINALEFAHNSGTGPVAVARVKSVSVGANAASGAQLILETASNNTGMFNTDQLVLRTDGNVRVSKDLSLGGGDVIIDPGEHLNILAPNGDGHLGGLSRVRAGGIAISNIPSVAVPTRGLYVQGTVDVDSAATLASADVEGALTVGGDLSVTGSATAKNSYECVNVSSELRCTLRQDWRVADKQSGFAMSWVDSDTCTSVCTRAGLKTCTDIQYNYECPNGSLTSSWNDDTSRSCSTSVAYRTLSTNATWWQNSSGCGTTSGYVRYRCRCAS